MDCCTLACVLVVLLTVVAIFKIVDRLVRLPRLTSVTDRYVLVTGCDTGFGRDIAKRIDNCGCNVFAGCLTESGLAGLKQATSGKLRGLHLDVSDPKTVRLAYEQVKAELPKGKGLWAILNNAGTTGKMGPVEWLHITDYDEVFNVNLKGLIDVTVTFLPLVKLAQGRIVNTSSILGRFAIPQNPAYTISKHGVEAFSDSLRRQMRDFGVSVHIIEPGYFMTNITSGDCTEINMRRTWEEAPQSGKDAYGEAYLEKSIRLAQKRLSMISTKTYLVVDAYEHAILGAFPRARYAVGDDTKYFLFLQSIPEWISDWYITKGLH